MVEDTIMEVTTQVGIITIMETDIEMGTTTQVDIDTIMGVDIMQK